MTRYVEIINKDADYHHLAEHSPTPPSPRHPKNRLSNHPAEHPLTGCKSSAGREAAVVVFVVVSWNPDVHLRIDLELTCVRTSRGVMIQGREYTSATASYVREAALYID